MFSNLRIAMLIALSAGVAIGLVPAERGLAYVLPLLLLSFVLGPASQTRDRLVRSSVAFVGAFVARAVVWQELDWVSLVLGPLFCFFWGLGWLLRASYQDLRVQGHWKTWLVSMIAWLLLALGAPPLPLGFLAPVVLALWFWALESMKSNPWAGVRMTFWTSLPAQALTYYWIIHVMQAGFWLAIGGGLVLLLLFLSAFPAFLAWSWYKLRSGRLLWLFPGVWAGLEVLRAWGEMSFPWNPLALVWVDYGPALVWSPWLGAYGVGAWIVACNLWTWWCWKNPSKLRWGIWVLVMVLPWAGLLMEKSPAVSSEIRVGLVQPNQDQELKWDPDHFDMLMDRTRDLLIRSDLRGSDLLLLPETSIPNFKERSFLWTSYFSDLADSLRVPILFGVLDWDYVEGAANDGFAFKNTLAGYWPQTGLWTSYAKVRLVPFSEALPFGKLFPVINKVNLGEGDFQAGPGPEVYNLGQTKIAPNLCYEIVYPQFVRAQIDLGAQLLVEGTNDGWFGRSSQPWQHFALVRLRAAENSIPVVRATNTGVSGVIDASGQILEIFEPYTETARVVKVPIGPGPSWYARWGDWVEWFWVLVGLIAIGSAWVVNQRVRCIRD